MQTVLMFFYRESLDLCSGVRSLIALATISIIGANVGVLKCFLFALYEVII